jgi:hypothetical protein
MDCRQFRNKHVAFVDDLLPAVEMDALQRHLTVCSRCSRQDTAVRRSLMLVRSLPPIEPSPEFMAKLNHRLQHLEPGSRDDVVSFSMRLTSVGAFAAMAAGIMAVAYMAVETSNYYAPRPGAQTPASVASLPAAPMSMGDAAFVASVSTGIPVWPAVLMVGQAPMRFADMDFRETDRTR